MRGQAESREKGRLWQTQDTEALTESQILVPVRMAVIPTVGKKELAR